MNWLLKSHSSAKPGSNCVFRTLHQRQMQLEALCFLLFHPSLVSLLLVNMISQECPQGNFFQVCHKRSKVKVTMAGKDFITYVYLD